jgi:hypothetical protein
LFSGSDSIPANFKPAGLDKSKGVITARYVKDPNDPGWKDDPGYMEFVAFVTKYMGAEQLNDPAVVHGYGAAPAVLRRSHAGGRRPPPFGRDSRVSWHPTFAVPHLAQSSEHPNTFTSFRRPHA